TAWDSAEVTTALEHFQTMIGHTNTDRDGLDWPDATQQLIDGTAAYNVMGDWAVAAFDEAGLAPTDDYVYFELPGADEIFGLLARRPTGLQPREGLDPGPHRRGHCRVPGVPADRPDLLRGGRDLLLDRSRRRDLRRLAEFDLGRDQPVHHRGDRSRRLPAGAG